jgi:HD-like signal output (HDOD) protein
VDLVILENELHAFLSGLEILERLYNDLLRPPTVLLANTSIELQERARKLGVDCILRPQSSPKEIVSAAQGLLAASNLSQVVIPLPARKLVQQSDAIRPLPQVLLKLYSYLDHEQVSMTEFAQDLSVDPKMTAELLKLTNSTAFGLRRKVTKVLDAVNFLGVRRTVSLVLSVAVLNAQSRIFKELPISFRTWYHQRSVLIASSAYSFARNLDDVSPDNAYVLGLLQDVGILVLAHAFEQKYQPLLQRSRDIGQLRLEIIEEQDLHMTHAEVSAALLQKWELPQSMVALVLSHHRPAGAVELSKTDQRFLHGMQVGEAIANLGDNRAPQRHQSLAQLLASYGPERAQQCRACLAEAVAKTAESSRLFSIPVPDEAALQRLLEDVTSHQFRRAQVGGGAPEAGHVLGSDVPQPATTLPVRASGVTPGPAPAPWVLIVDDEEAVARVLERILASVGIKSQLARSVEAARQLIPQAAALVLDVHLEGMNGIEFLRELRAEGRLMPALMISGDRTRGTVQACVEAGICEYLVKPFDRAVFLEKLRKHAPSVFPQPFGPSVLSEGEASLSNAPG